MKLKDFQKALALKALGGDISAEDLALINRYALKELTADEIYTRRFLLAHNAIDRDRERFPETLLDDFALTLPGKSMLFAHVHGGPGPALFFDAFTEEMTPEQFKALTGEDARLPDGTSQVKVLWGRWYMLKNDANEATIQNIDAGIYRHCSIGFRASDLAPVKGDYQQTLYWEYAAPGEATEGSLVWLGAQPGATVQKSHNHDDNDERKNKGGKELMNEFLKKLGEAIGKALTEDGWIGEVKSLIAERDGLKTKVDELAPLAADGKAYREDLVGTFVTSKAKVGDIDEKPESAESLKKLAGTWPLDFLKAENAALDKRIAEKFPAESQTQGDDRRDKSDDGKGKGAGENPLIPKDK